MELTEGVRVYYTVTSRVGRRFKTSVRSGVIVKCGSENCFVKAKNGGVMLVTRDSIRKEGTPSVLMETIVMIGGGRIDKINSKYN